MESSVIHSANPTVWPTIFTLILKIETDFWTHDTCVKIVITFGRDFGSAEWIKNGGLCCMVFFLSFLPFGSVSYPPGPANMVIIIFRHGVRPYVCLSQKQIQVTTPKKPRFKAKTLKQKHPLTLHGASWVTKFARLVFLGFKGQFLFFVGDFKEEIWLCQNIPISLW